MTELRLEPIDGLLSETGSPTFDIILRYEVLGLLNGRSAWIQNLDYPRYLWSVLHFKDGVPEDHSTGSFASAEDALMALQETQGNYTLGV